MRVTTRTTWRDCSDVARMTQQHAPEVPPRTTTDVIAAVSFADAATIQLISSSTFNVVVVVVTGSVGECRATSRLPAVRTLSAR